MRMVPVNNFHREIRMFTESACNKVSPLEGINEIFSSENDRKPEKVEASIFNVEPVR